MTVQPRSCFKHFSMNQSRISELKLGRSKFYNDKTVAFDGVYGNSRLMHAVTSLIGCVVQVQVRDGATYEGILRTFSTQLDLVLETTHKVSAKVLSPAGVGPTVSSLLASFPFEEGILDKLIFRLCDIVTMKASNVDADYAVKDSFTDTAISKYNGQIVEKELEPWEGASSDSESTALGGEEGDGTNGWDANDMFRTNAEKYGVTSSYDNSLQEYTVALNKKDTEEYKLKEAKASQIAHEIEANISYQSRIQLDNGDEEDKFSAVVRPEEGVSKYVLPQKRRNTQGLKRQSSTSSPVHVTNKPYLYSSTLPIPNKSKQQQYSHQQLPSPPLSPLVAAPTDSPVVMSLNGDGVEEDSFTVLDNVPPKPFLLTSQTLPPRIERRRENERKLKGRNDEIEEFRKFSSNFKLTEDCKELSEAREEFPTNENKPDSTLLANKLAEQVKFEKETDDKPLDISKSTLNPNAKEFVLNPNAKTFTPRSMTSSSPQTSVPLQPQGMQAQSPVIVVPHSQIIPGLPQPIFTAMAPQYMMQATPVSMSLTSAFGASSAISQAPRFRKVPITMQPRHDVTPSMHVAAATGQPILAPAAMPTPSQLTMQYTSPQGVIHSSGPPQQAIGYPQMNFVVGPRVVSPQPVGVVPTSHSVSYCDTSHLPAHLLNKYCIAVSAHPGASMSGANTNHTMQQGVSGQHSNHPPQSQTPILHPSPSPVHQVPNQHAGHSQPPTTVMYPAAGPMGQHPMQAAHHNQQMSHPMHQAHPLSGFPTGPQPVLLMHQQQQTPASHHGHQTGVSAHHPSLHMHSMHGQNHGNYPAHIVPQMAIIPTTAAMASAPTTISTPPFGQHLQGRLQVSRTLC